MKKSQFLNWMLCALMAFTFSSCDNEPLEGQFVVGGQGENGQFTALVDGVAFEATNVTATLSDGVLILTGVADNGSTINLKVTGAGPCTYNLGLLLNPGNYYPIGQNDNPFLSVNIVGGFGVMEITNYDADAQLVSGTFSFTGVREVTDSTGTTSTETVEVSSGAFTDVNFQLVNGSAAASECPSGGGSGGGGGGSGGGSDPEANFFALVNGNEFVDITFTAEQLTVAGQDMVKLFATADNGATMRIDIPEDLGVGTFPFMDPISDGTKLIAVYTTTGGETYTSDVGSGSITITEFGSVTGKLAANFAFQGTDPTDPGNTTVFQITEGAFNVDYIDDSGTVENSLSADIDGITYTPSSIEITQSPVSGNTVISITTIDDVTNQSLTISFPIDIEAGSYDMSTSLVDGTEKVGLYNPNIGGSILFASSPGTLNIISYELSSGMVEAT
ncbi:MAG: DUF6252 family protein, partial [Bacteroidota bacterium]